jgi:hypothetical protein
MFAKRTQTGRHVAVLATVLLIYPCTLLAQRGPGGAVGGGLAGAGGLSGSTGIASGLDTKDDLKGFHEVLALQATGPQIVQFKAMLKTTETVAADLRRIEDLAAKGEIGELGELKDSDARLKQAMEAARAANAKFLEQLSDPQKSGLKENIRRLTRIDSELVQQFRIVDGQVAAAKPALQQITASTQDLDRTLASFQGEQIEVGDEMSIAATGTDEKVTFQIRPVKSVLSFSSQPVTINTVGTISKEAELAGQSTFRFELAADLSDLQQNITDVLRSELNKADSCGEQVAVQSAVLTPAIPASLAVTQLHYERWACFGGGMGNEMAEGSGTIEVKLTPVVENGTLRLRPEIGRVDAEGLVGDLLRSGSLGETVRDKVAESVLAVLLQGTDYKAMLPPTAQSSVVLQRVAFKGTGAGVLSAVVEGDIAVSNDKVSSLIGELKAGEAKGQTFPAQTSQR